ncbi:MAG: MipA/OmpV family protein [Candidatus Omnitrophica bacterium]|nr:MipA/OmpV family protein [Candidatus Omnitrophota bacterium]
MKKTLIFFFILFCAGVSLSFADEAQSNYFGLVALTTSSPYKDVSTKVWPVPIISWHSKDGKFFVEGKESGYQVLKYQDLTLDAILRPRLMGYDDNDATVLNGMKDRKWSIDGGLRLAWNIPDSGNISVETSLVTDLLSEHQGQEAEIAVAKKFKGDIFVLKPKIGLRWQSQNLVDYYYGVQSTEATASRRTYEPSSSLNSFANLSFDMGVSKNWVMATMLEYEQLGSAIRNSPIVEKHGILTGLLGLIRRF